MIRDIQFGLKMLWKDRAYALTAILTLAVCIGANTVIFTVVHSVLLKPLPVPDSDLILQMSNQYPKTGSAVFTGSSVPDYYDRLRDMNVYEEQAMYGMTSLQLDIHGSHELIQGLEATPSFFRLLKVTPVYGRVFDESDGRAGNELKVILSYGLWQQLSGGDPNIVGRQMRMGARLRTIVGVMPQGFQFVNPEARFWTPLVFTDKQKSDDARHNNSWTNIARLKPGATIEQAQQQVNAINAANLERFPQFKELLVNSGFYTRVDRLQDVLVQNISSTLYLLWGGAAFVLLIGALNIANLALARSNGRIREVSTRLAIGASRAQVARQLITESLLLAFAGGGFGILAGFAAMRLLSTMGLERLPRAGEIQIDIVVLAGAFALAVLAGVLVGLVPIVYLSRVNLSNVLHAESRTGTRGTKARAMRRGLVVAQVAFAFVLLIGSGLLAASFRNLLASDPGFKPQGVMTAGIWMSESRYPNDPAVRRFTNRLLEAVQSVPGVTYVGGTTNLPLSGNHDDGFIVAEDYQMKPGESVIDPMMTAVTPGYFEAMGTALLRGRFFDERDNEKAPLAVIVDERLARKFWPAANPVGKRMYVPSNDHRDRTAGENRKWYTVVGVIREVRLDDLEHIHAAGAVYFPAGQEVQRGLTLAVKTTGDPAAALAGVRAAIKGLDPEMLLNYVRPMNEYVALSLMPRRTTLLLAASFGVVALFLSCLGVYGVLAFLVAQRFREIGIRIALGSTPLGIFRLVLHEGVVILTAGLILGLAGASALQRVLQNEVYGVAVMDPTVIGMVAIIFVFIALAACSIPAGRATRVDPVAVLNRQ